MAPSRGLRRNAAIRSKFGRSSLRKGGGALLLSIGVLLVLASPAYAIPSPDLAVNFFANIAQLVGLATAVVGGTAFGVGRARNKGRGTRKAAGGFPRWALVAVGGGLAVSVVVNVVQWGHSVNSRDRRLQTNLVRSSVEGGKRVGDTSLKTLSYSGQLSRKDGISTGQLEALLHQTRGTGKRVNLIDVREPEEREAGRVAGFKAERYPDLAKLIKDGKLKNSNNVLLCYSGNRSSELCSLLESLGIPCKFVIGGFEKWAAEGRAILDKVSGSEARGLPDYPRSGALLDTPDVSRLVREDRAIFVDVRYPQDFAATHISGAIDIPIREMPSTEMWAALKALPHRPVVAPCYDKRSCFYAKVLGLRLYRLGYDFRGRYTVPSEYVPVTSTAARLLNGSPSLVGRVFADARAELGRGLAWMNGELGSFFLAILAVVALFRLGVAPFTIKSERDQAVLRQIDDEIEGCRAMRADNPQAYGKRLREIYRRYRLAPAFNVIGVFVQVPLFVILFASIDAFARARHAPALWMADAAHPDPLHVLPATIGALVLIHLWLTARKKSAAAHLTRVAAGLGLAAITLPLAGAVNIYLTFSILLMTAQAQIVRAYVATKWKSDPRHLRVMPLTFAQNVATAGGKAKRLGQMVSAGLPVPSGFVAVGDEATLAAPTLVDRWRLLLAFRRLRAAQVAVRSSGQNEDGANRSYAGVFDTLLNVGRSDLFDALRKVRRSMSSERAGHYAGDAPELGSVVVQAMVPAEYAGVVFTRHPGDPAKGSIELVAGLGDKLVDGSATPHEFAFGRASGVIHAEDEPPPIDLTPLVALARRAERLFGGPQDIEWCYARGRFHLLQSRDITATMAAAAAVQREQDRLIGAFAKGAPDETILVQNEVAEVLPQPTPVSLSLLERLWGRGGSVQHALSSLGIRYDAPADETYLTSVLGRLYVNYAAHNRRFGRGASAWNAFRMARNANAIERRLQEFLPEFDHQMRVLEAIDLTRLDVGTLFDQFERIVEDFCEHHYAEAHVVNVVAEQYVTQASKSLTRRKLAVASRLSATTNTVVQDALELLARASAGDDAARDAFLDLFGHRAPYDFELAEPRYREMATLPYLPPLTGAAASPMERDDAALGWLLGAQVERARRFQVLKEEAKHHCLRELALIRGLLIEIDRRFELGGDVFFLALDEVMTLRNPASVAGAKAAAAQRRADISEFVAMAELPQELTPRLIETLGQKHEVGAEPASGSLSGTVVAGTPPIEGTARVVESQVPACFENGDILIVRSLHPDLVSSFGQIAGIVSEIGGWLSHAAILAREYGVPTVVGVRGATHRIVTGDRIRLELDGTLSILSLETDTPT